MINIKNLLREDPDYISKYSLVFNDNQAYAFGYDKTNKMRVGHKGEKHFEIRQVYLAPGDDFSQLAKNIPRDRKDFRFPGRIWVKKKLISFWIYPPKSGMERVFNDISNEMKKVCLINLGPMESWKIDLSDNIIIPLKNFLNLVGTQKRDPKELQLKHMKSPITKGDSDVPLGVGSRKYPAGLSYSQYAQLITTSEGKMKKSELKQIIKEEYTNILKEEKQLHPSYMLIKQYPGMDHKVGVIFEWDASYGGYGVGNRYSTVWTPEYFEPWVGKFFKVVK